MGILRIILNFCKRNIKKIIIIFFVLLILYFSLGFILAYYFNKENERVYRRQLEMIRQDSQTQVDKSSSNKNSGVKIRRVSDLPAITSFPEGQSIYYYNKNKDILLLINYFVNKSDKVKSLQMYNVDFKKISLCMFTGDMNGYHNYVMYNIETEYRSQQIVPNAPPTLMPTGRSIKVPTNISYRISNDYNQIDATGDIFVRISKQQVEAIRGNERSGAESAYPSNDGYDNSDAIIKTPKPRDRRNYEQDCLSCEGGVCSYCKGSRRIEVWVGNEKKVDDCPACNGTGKCQTCSGYGKIR